MSSKRRIRVLNSLFKFRNHALEQARIVSSKAKSELDQSRSIEKTLATRISDFESELRRGLKDGAQLSLGVLNSGRMFLDSLHKKLEERQEHTRALDGKFKETEELLGIAFRERETVSKLMERTIETSNIEETRRNQRELDELWLVGGGRA